MSNLVFKKFSLVRPFSCRSMVKTGIWLLQTVLVIAVLVVLSQMVLADLVEQGVKDSKPSGLLAGVAKINIDPAVGIPHMNWGSGSHIVAKGIDPVGLFMRALVLSDGNQKFCLVDVDSGVRGDEALKRASKLTGIPVEHIRLGSGHTHAGPNLPRSKGPAGADLRQ